MQLKFLFALVSLSFMIPCQGAVKISGAENVLRSEIASILKETSLREESDFAPYMIYSNNRFLEIYKRPCDYIDGAMDMVGSKSDLDAHEEIVLSNLLYDLPLGEYIDWIEKVYFSYGDGNVSLKFLERVAFPALGQRADLYLTYKSDRVRKLYGNISKYQDLSQRANELLGGKASTWIVGYFSGNQMELPSVNPDNRCKEQRGEL